MSDTKSDHSILRVAADSLVITGAFFGCTLGLVALLVATGPLAMLNVDQVNATAIAIQLSGGAIALLGMIGGPLLALWLNGRRIQPTMFAAILVGLIAGGFLGGVVAMLAPALAWLFTLLFGGGEFGGAIAVLVLVSAVFAAIVVWVVVRAVGDLRRGAEAHRALDVVRLVSVVLIIAVALAAFGLQMRATETEIGELAIFMMLAGVVGGVTAGAAEWFMRFLDRNAAARATSMQ